MKHLSIDIETYSSVDLKTSGVYKYVESLDFDILLLAYSEDFGPVRVVDLARGEKIPSAITRAIGDRDVTITAFNATFERICLAKYFELKGVNGLNPFFHPNFLTRWDCTMVRCARLGLPLSLTAAGKVLNIGAQKLDEGKALVRYFCQPCKPTKANGGRTRNLPEHDPEKWQRFIAYNRRDVEAENEIRQKVAAISGQISDTEQRLYALDQTINDHGVMVDRRLAEEAIRMHAEYVSRLHTEAVEITGLANPNSVAQLKTWLEQETGGEIKSLNKKDVPDLVKSTEAVHVKRLLAIRTEMGKTSVKKYAAMLSAMCTDNRVRGLMQYCGAVRTGRWAGRLVQIQNLPQNHIPDLDAARELALSGDLDMLEFMYGNVPDVLSQLIRTAFVAKPGYTFVVCDFSAIEARVIAWWADEQWRLDVFRTHGKIYEASAALMFRVPIESITKTDPRRQKGKIAELALGYQGGVGALKTMGGEKMGLDENEMADIVENWRAANPAVVRLWTDMQKAAAKAIAGTETTVQRGVRFRLEFGALTVQLPSGRKLYYPRARIESREKFGKMRNVIVYEGENQTTRKWETIETYGGKLVENIVQAIARDCLAVKMLDLSKWDIAKIVFHVHDEIVVETHKSHGEFMLEQMCWHFAEPISWAPDLPLKGDGYITEYYKKD